MISRKVVQDFAAQAVIAIDALEAETRGRRFAQAVLKSCGSPV
jgi:hypothetical protein